jgi:3-methyladenine DNA glycosylase/8-oxoguanine DNA glycosylase
MKRSDQMMDSLLRVFGEDANFDGKTVRYWLSTKKIAATLAQELQAKAKLGYRAANLVAIAKALEAGFPTMDELYAFDPLEAKKALMSLFGIGSYSAELVMPGMGFPLDVWSAKIFGVLFRGSIPENPRNAVPELKLEGERRWGRWAGLAFVYVLNDLPALSKHVGADLMGFYSVSFSFSHFLRHSQSKGSAVDRIIDTTITIMLVPPNWLMPKKVATVLGNEVTVVTMVR